MPRAQLTLTIPAEIWIGRVSREFPETIFRVQSVRSADGGGVAIVEFVGPSAEQVCSQLETVEEVREIERFDVQPERALVQIEVAFPLLLLPIESSGTPLQMPFEIQNGIAEWDVMTTQDRLSELAEQLDTFGIDYSLEGIDYEIGFERILTERQAEILTAALEAGYYDSPRTCTLTELAEDLEMAPSTCSEILHRAEERVIKRFDIDLEVTSP